MAKKSPQEANKDRAVHKVAKFKELAVKRTNRALKAMAGIANLSNRSSYTYDDGQVVKILSALKGQLAAVEASFKTPEAKKEGGFDL
jgi:hypothetical protein